MNPLLDTRNAKWLPTLQEYPQKGESILADYLCWLCAALSVLKCQALATGSGCMKQHL